MRHTLECVCGGVGACNRMCGVRMWWWLCGVCVCEWNSSLSGLPAFENFFTAYDEFWSCGEEIRIYSIHKTVSVCRCNCSEGLWHLLFALLIEYLIVWNYGWKCLVCMYSCLLHELQVLNYLCILCLCVQISLVCCASCHHQAFCLCSVVLCLTRSPQWEGVSNYGTAHAHAVCDTACADSVWHCLCW